MMFPPNEKELRQAGQLGIDPKDKSGPELRKLIAQAKRRSGKEPANGRQFAYLNDLRRRCGRIGIRTTNDQRRPELERLYRQRVRQLLSQRGIKQGVYIQIPMDRAGIGGKYAKVGAFSDRGNDFWHVTLTLYIQGAPRGYSYHAEWIALGAKVVPKPAGM